MSLPKLPDPQDLDEPWGYTEAQMLQLQRDTVEACASVCSKQAESFARDEWPNASHASYSCCNHIRAMLKEST